MFKSFLRYLKSINKSCLLHAIIDENLSVNEKLKQLKHPFDMYINSNKSYMSFIFNNDHFTTHM